MVNYKELLYQFDAPDDLLEKCLRDLFNSIFQKLRLESTDTILDIGCGSGFLFKYDDLYINKYIGIDLSLINLQTFKQYIETKQIKKNYAYYCQMDVLSLGFCQEKFDKIICCEVLEHINFQNQSKLIQEISRVLKPEGTIVITVPNAWYLWQYIPWSLKPFKRRGSLRSLWESIQNGFYDEHHPVYSPHFRYNPIYFSKLLTANGLVVKKMTSTYWYNNRYIKGIPINMQDWLQNTFTGSIFGSQLVCECKYIGV